MKHSLEFYERYGLNGCRIRYVGCLYFETYMAAMRCLHDYEGRVAKQDIEVRYRPV